MITLLAAECEHEQPNLRRDEVTTGVATAPMAAASCIRAVSAGAKATIDRVVSIHLRCLKKRPDLLIGSHGILALKTPRYRNFRPNSASDVREALEAGGTKMEGRREHVDLTVAEKVIAAGTRRIADQEQRVSELDRHGHDTTRACSLLALYRRVQAQQIAHRNLILRLLRNSRRAEAAAGPIFRPGHYPPPR